MLRVILSDFRCNSLWADDESIFNFKNLTIIRVVPFWESISMICPICYLLKISFLYFEFLWLEFNVMFVNMIQWIV